MDYLELALELLKIGNSAYTNLVKNSNGVDHYIEEMIMEHGNLTEEDWNKITLLMSINKIKKSAKNLIKIRAKSVEYCENNSISIKESPDDDWLCYFENMASYISGDELQEIWARILVKEHVERGSISKAMLSTLSLLDGQSASAFQALCNVTFRTMSENEKERFIPLVLYDNTLLEIIEKTADDEEIIDIVEEYKKILPSEEELHVLEDLNLIRLIGFHDEAIIYTGGMTSYEFSVGAKSWDVYPVCDEDDNLYFVRTGQATYTHLGETLYLALSQETNPIIIELLKIYNNGE